jgi:hypothetical protein
MTPGSIPGWLVCALVTAMLAGGSGHAAESPGLRAHAAGVDQFVPAGWAIDQLARADLNADGREDAVALLRERRAADPLRSPQRILAVLIGDATGFTLASQNAKLVPQLDLTIQEDPLTNGQLTARSGEFDIKLSFWSGAGSYLSAVVRYRFVLRNGCFQLVGYDRLETHRVSLEAKDLSINYLTGEITRTSEEAGNRVVTNTVSPELPRRCLADLGSAAEFSAP